MSDRPSIIRPMRKFLRAAARNTSTGLELVGLGLVTAGTYQLAPWLAYISAGVGLIALGWIFEPPKRQEP